MSISRAKRLMDMDDENDTIKIISYCTMKSRLLEKFILWQYTLHKTDTWNWTHYVNKIINGSVPGVASDNWVFACLRLAALNEIQILDDLQEKITITFSTRAFHRENWAWNITVTVIDPLGYRLVTHEYSTAQDDLFSTRWPIFKQMKVSCMHL